MRRREWGEGARGKKLWRSGGNIFGDDKEKRRNKMIKMHLRICGDSLKEIRACLKGLSEDRLHSNAYGHESGADFDYSFVMSDDLYSEDDEKDVIDPEREK